MDLAETYENENENERGNENGNENEKGKGRQCYSGYARVRMRVVAEPPDPISAFQCNLQALLGLSLKSMHTVLFHPIIFVDVAKCCA